LWLGFSFNNILNSRKEKKKEKEKEKEKKRKRSQSPASDSLCHMPQLLFRRRVRAKCESSSHHFLFPLLFDSLNLSLQSLSDSPHECFPSFSGANHHHKERASQP